MSIGNLQQLRRYARPRRTAAESSDEDTPLSFRNWSQSFQGIIPGQEYSLYNQYLTDWFFTKSQNKNTTKTDIKLSYLKLLRQLQPFFQQEEIEQWYNGININNDKEVLLAIPFFAKKLKDVALYYFELRENVLKSKTQYNLIGSNLAIDLQIKEFLLNNYTQRSNTNITIPSQIWRKVPALSSIKDTLNIEIEELYDFHNYLDHSTTAPASSYYNFERDDFKNYFNLLNLPLTAANWIYSTGVFNVSGNEITEIIDSINVAEEIINKYLGSNKSIITTQGLSSKSFFYDIPISLGNNFFYWPSGVYKSNIEKLPRFVAQPLSSVGLETLATAGSSIEFADTIFVKTKNSTQGAWLRLNEFDITNPVMQAVFEGSSVNRFKYPFPGYGLSANDIPWTGFSLSSDPTFAYLEQSLKQEIENSYWSTAITLTSFNSLPINSTALIYSKAHAADYREFADRIRVWDQTPAYFNSVYSGPVQEAWLYKMTQTNISIASGTDSTILWPFFKIDPEQDYPTVPETIYNHCIPTPLSSIQFEYATASSNISGADIIYKIQNYKNTATEATECAWLSGKNIYYPETRITAVLQPSLKGVFESGKYSKFLWQGENNTDCNSVFKPNKHQEDCKYFLNKNITYKEPEFCTCKQVMFTPFGHPGNNFFDNNALCDFIIEDTFESNNIDFGNWRDSEGKSLLESNNFAWFKTNNKIGWELGEWITGTGQKGLLLKQGRSYLYYRQNYRDIDPEVRVMPEYVVRHNYKNFNVEKDITNFKWIQGKKTADGFWFSTDNEANFTVYSGDLLLYSHQPLTTFTIAKSALTTQIISENRGSLWTNFDYLTINEDNNGQEFILNFPLNINYSTDSISQIPNLKTENFVSVLMWSVSAPNKPTAFFRNTPTITIAPSLTGIYSFSVTAISATTLPPRTVFSFEVQPTGTSIISATNTFYYTNTGLYVFNNIPLVTAVSLQSITYPTTSYGIGVPGFVLTTPLFGWDYNTLTESNKTIGNVGAKPYWAKTILEKNEQTDFKGVESWGNYITLTDQYNFIVQPIMSDLVLNTGSYVEYKRNTNTRMAWNQSLEAKTTSNSRIWSTLEFNTTGSFNLPELVPSKTIDLITIPTTKPSTLLLESIVENEPVEIYYNAIEPFTWSVTAVPQIQETTVTTTSTQQITNITRPWNNLAYFYYPNVAVLPTVENLSSVSQFGGVFTPSNLGLTQYLNRDYTTSLNLTSTSLSGIFNTSNVFLNGRGVTKQDQNTPFDIDFENNVWLKEPAVATSIAGTIKKDIFKKYQKFIPYQSKFESNPRSKDGIITPTSRLTPWTGPTDSDWSDLQNYPTSFTGELNVDNWSNSQILKNTNLLLDNWTTDIFGNQYGLYKNIKNTLPQNRKNVGGEIWVRKNSQKVLPSYSALSGVFDTYKTSSFYPELTGQGINHLEVFSDVMYIQTSGAVIFERLFYDFNNDNIFSLADDSRTISLAIPIQTNLNREFQNRAFRTTNYAKAGEPWYTPEQKTVLLPICSLSGTLLRLELFNFDINNLTIKKVFPTNSNDITLLNSLTSLNLQNTNNPVLTYNKFKKQYVLSVLSQNNNSQDVIIETTLNNFFNIELENITVYEPSKFPVQPQPPTINQSLYITQSITTPINFQINVTNGAATFQSLNFPPWVILTQTGLLSGNIPKIGSYTLPFIVSNNVGPVYQSIIIDAL